MLANSYTCLKEPMIREDTLEMGAPGSADIKLQYTGMMRLG